MKQISFYRFIYFGTCLRYLQDANSSFAVHSKGGVVDNIEIFFQRLDEFELHVTKRASDELKTFVKEVKDNPSLNTLTDDLANELRQIMGVIRYTLDAEATGKRVYVVSDKRYPIEKLLNDPSALFAKDVFTSLPEIARIDFAEAAQCIAFLRPTAAAFHMLRGTESLLRELYCLKAKRKRVELTWGPIVAALRNKKGISGLLLNHLDHIRNGFRNPTAHPNKVYDIDEAQDLLSICIDAANRIAQVLNKK